MMIYYKCSKENIGKGEWEMNLTLAQELELVIDRYNDEVEEDSYIYWWDIINEMRDMTDDEEVIRTIIAIERETERLQGRIAAGY